MKPVVPFLLSAAFVLVVNPADALDVLFVDNETPDPSWQALIESGGHTYTLFDTDAYDPGIGTAEEILQAEREARPNILTSSNWWDWGKKGTPYLDIAVKELNHFPEDNRAPGETCYKLEGAGWFWKPTSSPGSASMGNSWPRASTTCGTAVWKPLFS